jgi:hypothetical protein
LNDASTRTSGPAAPLIEPVGLIQLVGSADDFCGCPGIVRQNEIFPIDVWQHGLLFGYRSSERKPPLIMSGRFRI